MSAIQKLKWTSLSICILAAFLFSCVNVYQQATSPYNHDPDVSGKIIGSLDSSGTRFPPTSLEEIVDRSDLIVIGSVVSDTVNDRRPILSGTPLDQKFEKKFNKVPSFPIANVQIEIKEVLYGKTKKKEITYSQLGTAGSHSQQTKVKKNDNVVLFLTKDEVYDYYASVALEEGVFTLLPGNKLLSQSQYNFVAKYDEISLEILKEDVANIVQKIK